MLFLLYVGKIVSHCDINTHFLCLRDRRLGIFLYIRFFQYVALLPESVHIFFFECRRLEGIRTLIMDWISATFMAARSIFTIHAVTESDC